MTINRSAMDRNVQKEQFSNAFLYAVASKTGYSLYKPSVDDDSVDWGIKGYRRSGVPKLPQLELQLKCTAQSSLLQGDHLKFDLKIKNYDDLRATQNELCVPRILVVVLVPDDVDKWLTQSENELIMYRCAYWVSLSGKPFVTNKGTVRVTLPRINLFTVDALECLMTNIGQGVWP